MNRTRIVLSIAYLSLWFAGDASGTELVQRQGKYISLTTDLDSLQQCDALVASFDAAVPQWLEFWNLSEQDVASWKVQACVMADKARFDQAGLIPDNVPDFPFGFTLNDKVWVLVQQSEYYTRHLLLHEGAHSLAFHKWQGAGPTWFMEGTAEMLATHRGVGSEIKINQIPANRNEVPYWGRFKLMSQLRDAHQIPSLETVMRYRPNLLGQVDAYGWSWAATMLLRTYPEYRKTLLSSARHGRDNSAAFNRQLFLQLQSDWPVFNARWRLMTHELDYGFDWEIERVQLSERDPIWDGTQLTIQIAANRGWQSIGVRVPPGMKMELTATGTITLANQPKPWTSEPNGITFQYNRGRPIGQLIACLLPNASVRTPLLPELTVQAVGNQATVAIRQFSWVLLRVNDSVGNQSDNTGSYRVSIGR